MGKPVITYRAAERRDAGQLAELESICFTSDVLSKRNFIWMLTKANADIMVAEDNNIIVGYSLVLYKRATSLARLYSIAVNPNYQGQGIAQELFSRAENQARQNDCAYMRLEVRPDNIAALNLYTKMGYKPFRLKHNYYEDNSDALCLEKRIAQGESAHHLN